MSCSAAQARAKPRSGESSEVTTVKAAANFMLMALAAERMAQVSTPPERMMHRWECGEEVGSSLGHSEGSRRVRLWMSRSEDSKIARNSWVLLCC